MWQTALSYLAVQDIIPHVPRCCRFFRECVWGPWAVGLLWRELAPGVIERRSPWAAFWNENLLMRACHGKAPATHIRTLLGGGANIHHVDQINNSAIFWTVVKECPENLRLLLDAKCEPNTVSRNGRTLILSAAFCGSTNIVQILLDAGANVNQVDAHGWTALMDAASFNHVETVKALLNAGADINIANRLGHTALDITQDRGHRECTDLLLSKTQNQEVDLFD
jgi:ankyrin repeat protein